MFFSLLKKFFAFNRRSANANAGAYESNRISGLWGEKVAADFLKKKGFSIIGRRVRLHRDEIDIVASRRVASRRADGGVGQIVFVEVKTRASDLFGGGLAAVNKRKRHALCRAAMRYLSGKPKVPYRFDIIEVVGTPDTKTPPTIRHYENAFSRSQSRR